uniref:DNA 3'-5' helicase n=1 Tax=Cyanothece sp. (strain PCC 7425 / ATCC 29141) TaxID=395961 RepID=B8HWM9_CYAP4
MPAILQMGLTLVISPLVALMEDQVEDLRQRQLPAAALHSDIPPRERQGILRSIERQQLRLLYLSPESLFNAALWTLLCQPQIRITGMVLDEAHCLAQWGETFRPTYRRLGTVRPALLKQKPPGTRMAIAAFTATADPPTQRLICSVLHLQQPKVFRYSPYRPNLELRVQTVWSPGHRRHQLFNFIKSQSNQAGLVYARTRRDCETLVETLREEGYRTAAYHAGLAASQRRQLEADWISGNLPFVVCTNAFGMGINKPNCRWVTHFQAPFTLPEYIQEVGRGGRDGQRAIALTLVSEPTGWLDSEDQQRRKYLQNQLQTQQQEAWQLVAKLPQEGDIHTLTRAHPQGAIALALLHSLGYLTWRDPFNYVIHTGVKTAGGFPMPTSAADPMVQYFYTKTCRWQFLLQAFGFSQEAKNFRCGYCNTCQK